MSEPPKVLTAGGAASASAGKKSTPNRNRGNRRRKKKAAAAAASGGGDAKQQADGEADLLGTATAVEAGTKATSSTASAGGGRGGGATTTAKQHRKNQGGGAKAAVAAAAAAASSPPRGKASNSNTHNPRRSPNNPQTGSPPSDSEGSPSGPAPAAAKSARRPPPPPPPLAPAVSEAPVVLVAGGGTKQRGTVGGSSGAESDTSRKSENRLPGQSSPDRRASPGGGGDDDGDDDGAFFHDQQDDDDAAHIGELDLSKPHRPVTPDDLYSSQPTSPPSSATTTQTSKPKSRTSDLLWLLICFLGIMGSFVVYGLLLEYTTSGGRKLHELSFLFVTSSLYTVTAAAGRYVRQETPTSIPPARFAVLGLTSMGSTFCSVRSLRYVIYPIQVLAKSCKPVPVMIMGAFMGKRYPLRKYVNVLLIVAGVGLFMGGGSSGGGHKKHDEEGGGDGAAEETEDSAVSSSSQIFGIVLLFVSLCFDGGTGAYEDKLMSVHSVQPFDLMYNIQLGKTILAGVGLLVLNQVHVFLRMCQDMGFLLVALGLSGAMGQVFIFVTIAKFGALTCSIIGLARKVTTLVASIYFYGHELNGVQFTGLVVAVGSMVMNFWGKSGKKGGGHGGHGGGGGGHCHGGGGGKDDGIVADPEETKRMLSRDEHSGSSVTDDTGYGDDVGGDGRSDIELGAIKKGGTRTIS